MPTERVFFSLLYCAPSFFFFYKKVKYIRDMGDFFLSSFFTAVYTSLVDLLVGFLVLFDFPFSF